VPLAARGFGAIPEAIIATLDRSLGSRCDPVSLRVR
jgi:hypothetical protein